MNKWVRTKNELPKKNQIVIASGVSSFWRDGKYYRYYTVAKHLGNGLFVAAEDGEEIYPPTHWMLLEGFKRLKA